MHVWCHADSKHPQADANFFNRREFCFTLDGDIFVRYQSFKARSDRHGLLFAVSYCYMCIALQNGDELRTAIMNKLPAKIDIGPVYNVDPKHRNAYSGDYTCSCAQHSHCQGHHQWRLAQA